MATTAFTIIRGDSFSITLTIKNADNTAMNLTGKTIFFTAKKWKEDTDANAVIMTSVEDLVSPADGIVTISLSASVTAELVPGVYWWDIQLVNGDNVQSTVKQRLRVSNDVTVRLTDLS